MKNKSVSNSTPIPKSKKLIFNLILALMPILFVLLFELLLRVVGYGDKLSLFINHPDKEYAEYYMVNPEVGKKYFQKFEYTKSSKDIFLKNKPEDVFRIFVMGSSTVIGFPYDHNLMFSRILNQRLKEAYPNRKIEVVNTAITAINSFTLLDFMPQILRYKPDAILFYAGHNEYYGAFGVGSNEAATHNPTLIKIHLKLMNFRVYQFTKNIIGGVINLINKTDSASQKRGTLMTRIVKDADITYNSDLYKEGIENFRNNLEQMLAMADKDKVPVFISDLVSNLRDMKPFKSVKTEQYEEANAFYKKALLNEQENNFELAYQNYTKARDYDCVRFRASSDINLVIEELARKHKATLVATNELFRKNSQHGIIGDNLVTEHVHPNVRGQFLLSESFYKSITDSKIIDAEIDLFSAKPLAYFTRNYGFTYLDYLVGKHRVTNLKYHWPFKDETKDFVDYRLVYQPTSFIDSLAFNVVAISSENLTGAHTTLAEKFEKEGNLQNAFNEYNALTKINPYWPVYYRNAADCLLKMNDLPGALTYYRNSLVYGETFYAHFRAGEICLIKNTLNEAINHFKKALELADEKEKASVLLKLYIAYNYLNDSEKSEQVKEQLLALKPDVNLQVPPKAYAFNRYIPQHVQLQIDDADEFFARGEAEKALESLLKSLEIYDTHIANRKLAEYFYNNNEVQKSLFFFTKAYDAFKGDPAFLHYYIISNLANKQVAKAQEIVEVLEKTEPSYPGIPKLKGYINSATK